MGSTPIDPSLGTTVTGAIDVLKGNGIGNYTSILPYETHTDNGVVRYVNSINFNKYNEILFMLVLPDSGTNGRPIQQETWYKNISMQNQLRLLEYTATWNLALDITVDQTNSRISYEGSKGGGQTIWGIAIYAR